jgi:hypothetical protein
LATAIGLAGQARADILFADDFNRPDGPVGNGWSTWWAASFDHPNIHLTNGELRTAGFPNLGGGIYRTLPVSFPLRFSFDFRTLNLRDDLEPGLPYNDGGWQIFFNADPSMSFTPVPNQSPAQFRLIHVAGSRNMQRGYFDGSAMVYDFVPNVAEPIPGQRDYGPMSIARVEGLVNSDLSAMITVYYNDGQLPEPVTFVFGLVAGPIGAPPGSTLILANANRSFGPHFFDNLEIRTTQAIPEPGTLILFGLGTMGLLCYAWRLRQRKER